jgi:pyruvate/2-oxoglutarate dehydrogenase complex dihydrolipoamide acyltransferase (E2) component
MPFSHQLKFPSYNGSPVAARLEQWRKKPSDFLERGDVLAEISIDGSAHLLCIDFSCLLSSLIAKTGDLLPTGDHLDACAAEGEDLPYHRESLVIHVA